VGSSRGIYSGFVVRTRLFVDIHALKAGFDAATKFVVARVSTWFLLKVAKAIPEGTRRILEKFKV